MEGFIGGMRKVRFCYSVRRSGFTGSFEKLVITARFCLRASRVMNVCVCITVVRGSIARVESLSISAKTGIISFVGWGRRVLVFSFVVSISVRFRLVRFVCYLGCSFFCRFWSRGRRGRGYCIRIGLFFFERLFEGFGGVEDRDTDGLFCVNYRFCEFFNYF